MVSSADLKAIAFVCIMDVEPPESEVTTHGVLGLAERR